MIRLGTRLTAEKAEALEIVASLADDYHSLIQAAVKEVGNLGGKIPKIPDHPVKIPPPAPIENPMAGNLRLSDEVVEIITEAIQAAAAAPSFEEALDMGYRAFGHVSCTAAAAEGISAFIEKRVPRFEK